MAKRENKSKLTLLKFLMFILDIILVQASVLIVYYIRLFIYFKNRNFYPTMGIKPYIITYPIITFLIIFLFYLYDLYSPERKNWRENFVSIIAVFLIMFLFKTFISYFFRVFGFPRSVLILSTFIEIPIFLSYRYYFWKLLLKFTEIKKIILLKKEKDLVFNQILDETIKIEKTISIDEDFDLKTIEEYIKNGYDIMLTSSFEPNFKKQLSQIVINYNRSLIILPDLYDFLILSSEINPGEGKVFINFKGFELTENAKIIKRLFDIFFSLITLIILSPLFLIIAIAIKINDFGPVFYKQERIGENFKKFYIIKFRSMVVNAEKNTGPVLATDNDTRITKIGKFLRKYRLDEIPQFINVLKGNMSIVGPRPEREFFVNKFIEINPLYKYRFNTKPGITGLAQIYSKYDTSFEEKLLYDLLYIVKWSFYLDLWIIILTIRAILSPESAK